MNDSNYFDDLHKVKIIVLHSVFFSGWLSERLSFDHAFVVLGGIEIATVMFLVGLRQSSKRTDDEKK